MYELRIGFNEWMRGIQCRGWVGGDTNNGSYAQQAVGVYSSTSNPIVSKATPGPFQTTDTIHPALHLDVAMFQLTEVSSQLCRVNNESLSDPTPPPKAGNNITNPPHEQRPVPVPHAR